MFTLTPNNKLARVIYVEPDIVSKATEKFPLMTNEQALITELVLVQHPDLDPRFAESFVKLMNVPGVVKGFLNRG